jgi:molecular chaperone GrpE
MAENKFTEWYKKNRPELTAEEEKMISEVEQIEKQRDEYLAGWQRSKADFINYKKEELKHLEDVSRYGSESLIKEIIIVMDDFDLALRVMEKNGGTEGIDKGIYMIRSKIEDVLRKKGLEKIKISPGDIFDPSVAEAMLEATSDKPPGTIVEEIEPGYRLYEKILRPARVILSKGQN